MPARSRSADRSSDLKATARVRRRPHLPLVLVVGYVVSSMTLAATASVLYLLSGFRFDAPITIMAVVYPAVAALIVANRPRSVVGWLLAVAGAMLAISLFSESYTYYAVAHGPLPLVPWAAWYVNWSFGVAWALVFAAILLFPNGRLPSPRWRAISLLATTGFTTAIVLLALQPGALTDFKGIAAIDNPIGIAAAGAVADRIGFLLVVVVPLVVLTPVAAIVTRLRCARGAERRQVEWLAWIFSVAAFAYLGRVGLQIGLPGRLPWLATALNQTAGLLMFVGLPVAIAVAILRHNLYDIDIIINRTLVFGLASAALGVFYGLSIILCQFVLQPLTARSNLAVAVSTLAVAALFSSVRRRAQRIVDRRFYRHKYDAERTLAAFVTVARDEIELDRLQSALTSVVADTMQPQQVFLWLRER
jgi:hypothetical protein